MKRGMVLLIGFALGTVWCQRASLVHRAPAEAAGVDNPLEASERNLRAGARLFARECAACHGGGREGRGKVPPLNVDEVRLAPPGVLFWVLRNGSIRSGMPSFAHLPEAERWQIVTWLRGAEPLPARNGPVNPAGHVAPPPAIGP